MLTRKTTTAFFLIMASFTLPVLAQDPSPVLDRTADFQMDRVNEHTVRFTPLLPPQIPMQGAPEPPSYEFFWEFGDGSFSFEEQPEHTYSDPGSYEAVLWATGKYDNGKPGVEFF